MRYLLSPLFCLIILTPACKKNKAEFPFTDGTYTGTFQRQSFAFGQISNVTLTFSGNTWTGQSQFSKYPALCHGTFKNNTSFSITFENDCAWTAEFDWSLILSGNYQFKTDGRTLEISRNNNGGYKDIYKLTKL